MTLLRSVSIVLWGEVVFAPLVPPSSSRYSRSISRFNAFLLHCLRTHSAFTSKLACIRRKQADKFPTFGVPNDIEHVWWKCGTCDSERNWFFTALRPSGYPHSTVDSLLFPQGRARSQEIFIVLHEFPWKSDHHNKLLNSFPVTNFSIPFHSVHTFCSVMTFLFSFLIF